MPPKPVSLTARFNAFYALTLASNPPNGGQVTVVNPSSDGYYGANLLVTLSVKAAPGFVFSGFSGDLTGTNTKFGMSGPMAITANFLPAPPPPVNSNPNPMITFQSNVALPIPIIVGNTTSAMPFARTFAPGALSVSVPKDYARPDMPGVRYLFTQWSDGVSTPSRSLAVGPTAIALTALYVQQVHVQVRADPAPAGSVSGGGWYDVGSNATVTATANVGAAFVQFSGSTQSSSNPVTFAVASSPMAVVANFQRTQ
jgi:hypothetical protein